MRWLVLFGVWLIYASFGLIATSLAPLVQPPFYAVKVEPGELGTFAGIATNSDAQVLDTDGAPIPGLYAVGNDALSVMGGAYPGAGITLGPAMTFGFIAGRHLARQAGEG